MIVPYAAGWAAFGSIVLALGDIDVDHRLPDAQLNMRLSSNADTQLALQVHVDPSTHLCGHSDVTLNGLRLDRGTDGWGSGDILMTAGTSLDETYGGESATNHAPRSFVSSVSAIWDFECQTTDDNKPESEILTVTITSAKVQRISTSRTALNNTTTTTNTPIQNAVFKLLIDPTRPSRVAQVLGSDITIAVPAENTPDEAPNRFTTPRNPDLQQALVELEMVRRQRSDINRLVAEYEAYIGSLTTDVLCEVSTMESDSGDSVSDERLTVADSLNQCDNVHCVMKALVGQVSSRANTLIKTIANTNQTPQGNHKTTCRFPYSSPKDKNGESSSEISAPSRPAWPPAFCGPISTSTVHPATGSSSQDHESLINTGHKTASSDSVFSSDDGMLSHPSLLPGSTPSDTSDDEAFWLLVAKNTMDVIMIFSVLVMAFFVFRFLLYCMSSQDEKRRDYDYNGQPYGGGGLGYKAAFRNYVRAMFNGDLCRAYDGEAADEEKQLGPAATEESTSLPMHHRYHEHAPGRGLSRPPSYCTTASQVLSDEPPLSGFSRSRALSQSSQSSRTSHSSLHSVSAMSMASTSTASTSMEQSFAQIRAAVSMVSDMVTVNRGLGQRIVGSYSLRGRTGDGTQVQRTQRSHLEQDEERAPRSDTVMDAQRASRPMSPESTRSLYSIPPRYEYIDEGLPGYQTDEEAGGVLSI
ncbi:hypothetical protein CFIMG_002722RA [Ceratocystis fimbriata CBS 114723]|uniref:Uncharacterized protein n=1 Tax=Ceratocystis fimbriata CBS 114723 TaxID=1035309 RepID=A0A2C5X261_9PEZI|nr:hypothetical protein CFIMG_002722RA [Ceratocystis fimbriata CBS 114723]